MKEHFWKIFAVVAVLAIGASIVYSNSVANKANEGIEFTDHMKGAENPTVVLTEYSDFQCPACGQFSGILKTILEEYPDTLALEYKHYPLISIHPFAIPAAKAAEAAGQQGKFFEMHDLLFENQQVWSNSANPTSYFIGYAQSLGLDVDLFKQHMKASKIEDKIEAEFREARERNLTGTPSFFLNGERMTFETYEDFVAQIDAAAGGAVDATTTETVSGELDVSFGL